jgi:hydroxyethylthiazole kinase
MNITIETLSQDINNLKINQPLIHNITNYVAMNTSANVLLAVGASPLMAHAIDELAEIISLSQSLVLNIGTLDATWLAAMEHAQQLAKQKNIPIILDPVGAGASQFRTNAALKLLTTGVDIVRGNANEIMALTNLDIISKGVDATCITEMALESAKAIASTHDCIVSITGAIDIVVHNETVIYLKHGDPLLTRVTAMGCALSALVGAFAAINNNYPLATCHAILAYTIAAEKAAINANGPGTFYPCFLDQLAALDQIDYSKINYESY